MKHGVVGVLRSAGRILVILRSQRVRRPGFWTLPSGTVEPGETQAQTLVREMREEVNLEVRAGRKVWECPTDDASFTLHWWTAEIIGGQMKPDGVEVSEARWLTPEEFAELEPTFEADHEFFEHVFPQID